MDNRSDATNRFYAFCRQQYLRLEHHLAPKASPSLLVGLLVTVELIPI